MSEATRSTAVTLFHINCADGPDGGEGESDVIRAHLEADVCALGNGCAADVAAEGNPLRVVDKILARDPGQDQLVGL